ncbi:MAG: DUF4252 domain-containing protein [Gammaproteobacteria bacterium]|nr:MAG: DUF4252 domain-containing protein [Gammaproteobacteria bacterium]
MKSKTLPAFAALALGLVLVLPAALAQHPGRIDLADFAVFEGITPIIEVKLDGRMLRFAGAAAKYGNHAGLDLAANLEAINVFVYDVETGDEQLFMDRMAELSDQLMFDGWEAAVTVRGKGHEYVRVFFKGEDEYLDGITVLVLDDEAVFVNIYGRIDPETIAQLMDQHGHMGDWNDFDIDIDL